MELLTELQQSFEELTRLQRAALSGLVFIFCLLLVPAGALLAFSLPLPFVADLLFIAPMAAFPYGLLEDQTGGRVMSGAWVSLATVVHWGFMCGLYALLASRFRRWWMVIVLPLPAILMGALVPLWIFRLFGWGIRIPLI